MPRYALTIPNDLDAELRGLAFLQETTWDYVLEKAIGHYIAISREIARDPDHIRVVITRDDVPYKKVDWT